MEVMHCESHFYSYEISFRTLRIITIINNICIYTYTLLYNEI